MEHAQIWMGVCRSCFIWCVYFNSKILSNTMCLWILNWYWFLFEAVTLPCSQMSLNITWKGLWVYLPTLGKFYINKCKELIKCIWKYFTTGNSGHYVPYFLPSAEGFGSPLGSQWWPLATTGHPWKEYVSEIMC